MTAVRCSECDAEIGEGLSPRAARAKARKAGWTAIADRRRIPFRCPVHRLIELNRIRATNGMPPLEAITW